MLKMKEFTTEIVFVFSCILRDVLICLKEEFSTEFDNFKNAIKVEKKI